MSIKLPSASAIASRQAEFSGPGEVPAVTSSYASAPAAQRDALAPHSPCCCPQGTSTTGDPAGSEQRDGASGRDGRSGRARASSCAQSGGAEGCNKVRGTTQMPCTRLPRCNVISAQSLAALSPLVCSSSRLYFLQLLLLESALERPDFAELLKVASENAARNLSRCSFSESHFWGVWATGLELFLHQSLKENKPRTLNLSAALNPTNGMTAEASRCKPKPELNQTTTFYTAHVKERSQPRSDRTSRCNFTTANRDFSRAPTTSAHHETLSGHGYRTGWIHLNKNCKTHLRITANTQPVDPRPNSSSNTS